MTSDLIKRVSEHKTKAAKGFTYKYNLDKLVYFKEFDDIEYAIQQEKRVKRWHRAWKIELIEKKNPEWKDLFYDFFDPASVQNY